MDDYLLACFVSLLLDGLSGKKVTVQTEIKSDICEIYA
jgi:hypothetical protein